MTLTSTQLAETFALVPRAPYVSGRGALLWDGDSDFDPRLEPTGKLHFASGGAGSIYVFIALQASGGRFLVECTTWGHAGSFSGLAVSYPHGPAHPLWSGSSTPVGNVVSFLTPPVAAGEGPLLFRLRPDPRTVEWGLLGCEVTRVALP